MAETRAQAPVRRPLLASIKGNCAQEALTYRPPGGLMSSLMVGCTAGQREINMLVQLYRLPHGTRIDSDGLWKVVQ